MTALTKALGEYAATVITSNLLLIVLLALIFVLAYRLGRADNTHLHNILIATVGLLCGWLVGMMSAPYTSGEQARFLGLVQAVSVFLSGYVLSKFDRIFEAALQPDKVFQPVVATRLGLFFANFLVGFILLFTNRSYFRPVSPDLAPPARTAAPTPNPATPAASLPHIVPGPTATAAPNIAR